MAQQAPPPHDSPLYFRQLLAGRDFAAGHTLARQMVNFVYLIGDRRTGECLVVDPAWDTDGLLATAERDGMRVAGVLATHWHPDHVGGDLFGNPVAGVRELLERVSVPIHANRAEKPWIVSWTGVSEGDVRGWDSGDVVRVGDVEVTLVHTPGHTEGSQCFLVDGKLVAGDTLFLDGCGRTDLPGGDKAEIYRSITQRLARVPDSTVLYPGHLYAPEPSATLGTTRARNYVFKVPTLEQWLALA